VAAHRDEGPGENGTPIPRDLPDQQTGAGEDPWEVSSENVPGGTGGREQTDVPDTDEAGTGRQGAPRTGAGRQEQPVSEQQEHPLPDEPSG
jgi:hypothetical protein